MGVIFMLTFVLISAQIFKICAPAKILCVAPIPSISHQVVYRALVSELAKRGHEVVIITPDPLGAEAPPHYENVTEIDVHDISYEIWNRGISDPEELRGMGYFSRILTEVADAQLSAPAVKSFLKSNQTFDLVFAEIFCRISFAYADYFKAPVIGIISMVASSGYFEAVGSPTHPLLYPEFEGKLVGKTDLWQKLMILLSTLSHRFVAYRYSFVYDDIAKKHFGTHIRPVQAIENKMEMLFINTNPILHGVRPMVPAVVQMGNMHIQPKKKLPKDLQTFLDRSTQGVIYFSLGTNLRAKNLPPEILNSILSAFVELPYIILWKFEDDILQGKPDNVHISKWFPQRDLLGHPNVKAFVTQGGQQSMEEAVVEKVPLVGIPFVADQPLNVQRMVLLGIGVELKPDTITKDTFKEAIIEVAEGESYHKNVARVSSLVTDFPMSGMERAVWWTEYVLRHGNAQHLRAPAADVTWIEYFMLDVLGALLLLLFLAVLTLYAALMILFKYIASKTCRSKLKKQ